MNTRAFLSAFLLSVMIVSSTSAGSLEDIRRKVGKTDSRDQADTGSRNPIQIQSVNKGVVNGWVFDQGAGTRMVRSMDVRFKIRKKGQVDLDYICCYLFDRDKKEVKKLTEFLELTPAGTQEPVSKKVFNGGKTTTIQFVYPNEVNFKYAIAVIGSDKEGVSVYITPKAANLNDFEFAEKKLLAGKEKPAGGAAKKSQ